jgi:hypothetical protein
MMRVSELEGALLDCWVAKVEGWKAYKEKRGGYELCVVQFPGDREPWTCYRDHEAMKAKYTEIPLTEAVKIGFYGTGVYKFSEDWGVGGPIIEREKIVWTWVNTLDDKSSPTRMAVPCGAWDLKHKSPLVAAMRSFVASKYGETVPCPDKE